MSTQFDDPAFLVQELSANPTCNCALHHVVSTLGGKIVIPLEAFEKTRSELRDKEHPLIAYYDESEGIVIQVI
jgi:hypothetical protein